jgi:lipoyl-dependent peroxiredoxin
MKREANAHWTGTLQEGKGTLSTKSGVLKDIPYTFGMRFGEESGTNPEELVGAAHAGCFSMAFSLMLTKAGFAPKSIQTTATITFEQVNGNFTVTSSHLRCEAAVPEIDNAKFQQIAEDAKNNCPISRLLKSEITIEASLKA